MTLILSFCDLLARLRSPIFKNFLRPLCLCALAAPLCLSPPPAHAQVYNKYESADTFEHVIESMHAFAAFPAPFRASGLGYREMLAVARAFVAANATAAAAALSARLTAPTSNSNSSSSTADGVSSSSSPASEQLDVCLALLRGFGAADAARASIDLRDIDAFVALVLDSDTLSTDEWVLPAPGAIIDQWHAIEAPSPVCVRCVCVCVCVRAHCVRSVAWCLCCFCGFEAFY
jgi:hypothetical protein